MTIFRFILSALVTTVLSINSVSASEQNVLEQMFEWWNEAYHSPDGFTEDAFRKYFTEDAKLIIDGQKSAEGIPDLAAHFQSIQSRRFVEIVLPFEESFSAGNKIFTFHFVRRETEQGTECMRTMGYATIEHGKIALIDFVRTPEPKHLVAERCGRR